MDSMSRMPTGAPNIFRQVIGRYPHLSISTFPLTAGTAILIRTTGRAICRA
jgi:hypothetical protein